MSDAKIAHGAAIGVAYFLLLIILLISATLLSDRIKRSALSGLDRALGVLFGFFRGVCVPLGICIVFLILQISQNEYVLLAESKISGISFTIAHLLMPDVERHGIGDAIREKQRTIRQMEREAMKVSTYNLLQKQSDDHLRQKPNSHISAKSRRLRRSSI
jgi:uncharacterized membrane protein required for colicin V production